MFNTDSRIYHVSDAPGHQKYASLMVNSVLMSNFAILIVSAQTNECKSGFSQDIDQGTEGSSRQHLKILKASNCKQILVAINKMDANTV